MKWFILCLFLTYVTLIRAVPLEEDVKDKEVDVPREIKRGEQNEMAHRHHRLGGSSMDVNNVVTYMKELGMGETMDMEKLMKHMKDVGMGKMMEHIDMNKVMEHMRGVDMNQMMEHMKDLDMNKMMEHMKNVDMKGMVDYMKDYMKDIDMNQMMKNVDWQKMMEYMKDIDMNKMMEHMKDLDMNKMMEHMKDINMNNMMEHMKDINMNNKVGHMGGVIGHTYKGQTMKHMSENNEAGEVEGKNMQQPLATRDDLDLNNLVQVLDNTMTELKTMIKDMDKDEIANHVQYYMGDLIKKARQMGPDVEDKVMNMIEEVVSKLRHKDNEDAENQ